MHANVVQMSGLSKDDAIDLRTPPSTPPKKKKRKKVVVPQRRSSRVRSLCQMLLRHEVSANGDCLYISVLKASKKKGLAPGTKCGTPTELRAYVLKNIDKVIKDNNLEVFFPNDVLDGVKRRLALGLEPKSGMVPDNAWGGESEIQIMARLFNIKIVSVSFPEDRVVNNMDITGDENEIILAYMNDNHYDWAEYSAGATTEKINECIRKKKKLYLKF